MVGLNGLLPFTVLVELEVKLSRVCFHLLVADGASVGEQRETIGGDDLIHVLLPEGHACLLFALGPQFGGFQEDDHQSVQGIDLVLGQMFLATTMSALRTLLPDQASRPKWGSAGFAREVMSSAAVFCVTAKMRRFCTVAKKICVALSVLS
jgi:hypothetical protein